MSNRRIIALDIDGVLADFVYGFTLMARNRINSTIPLTWTHEQVRWDSFKGMDDIQIKATWQQIDASPVFWKTLPSLIPYKAKDSLHALAYVTDLYFTTSRRLGVDVVKQTREWLQDHTGITHPNVIITARKGEVAAAINADYLLDDKAGNVIYAKYHNPKTQCFVLNRPYNHFDPDVTGSKVTRVDSLEGWLDIVWKNV